MTPPFRLGLLFLGRRPAARYAEVARIAESLGFDSFWVPDERFFREVYSLCAVVAGATERIQIGPCVTDPYTRHPVLTAMAVATLDELSGGRALLGLGAGVSGFHELGLAQPQPARAVAETAALTTQLLSGEQVAFHGSVFSFEGKLDFVPPRPRVPIYIAAGGPYMLAVAGECADGVIIEGCLSPGILQAALQHVRRGAAAAGRAPDQIDIVARLDTAIADTLDEAYAALRMRVARHLANSAPSFERFTSRGLTVPDDLRALATGIGYTHDAARLHPLAARVTPEMIDAFAIAATPATLAETLAPLLAQGVTQLLVNPITPDDHIEPLLRAVAAWRRATFPAPP